MPLLTEPWPWWLGALALSLVSFCFLAVARAGLGVSGSFMRVLFFGDARRAEEAERAMPDDTAALEAALLAATLEEFGDLAATGDSAPGDPASAKSPGLRAPHRRAPVSAHFVFLGSMMLGGLIASLVAGSFELRWSLGVEFEAVFGDGLASYAALVVGGVFVGFGTAMAGGCTSGHGLTGCSRAQGGSLAATSVFFGVGVLVSLLLQVVAA